ncbi:MAG: hypothetical protein OEW87_10580, partial [Flavobacteriaceae bacterium]|nr:hypothetical protein [Flavobacteriaceae bacterium]
MRIRTQIVSTIVGGSILLLVLLGVLKYINMSTQTRDVYAGAMEMVSRETAQNIERYYRSLELHIQILSESRYVEQAFSNLNSEFKKSRSSTIKKRKDLYQYYGEEYLEKIPFENRQHEMMEGILPTSDTTIDLQNEFIVNNSFPFYNKDLLKGSSSNYGKAHRLIHQKMRNHLKELGLYDLFIINNKKDIIYTVNKEIDFARNLNEKVFSSTGVKEVYECAITGKQKICISELRPYFPSYFNTAAFMATPLRVNDVLVGVVAIQIPISQIEAILNPTELSVNDDVLNNIYKIIIGSNDDIVRVSATQEFNGLELISLKSKLSLEKLKGEKFIIQDEMFYMNHPIKIAGLDWQMLSMVPSRNIVAVVNLYMKQILIVSMFVVLILALFAYKISRKITRPINLLRKSFMDMKNEKITEIPVDTLGSEFQVLGSMYNDILHKIDEAFHSRNRLSNILASLHEMIFISEVKKDNISGNVDIEIKSVNKTVVKNLKHYNRDIVGCDLREYISFPQELEEYISDQKDFTGEGHINTGDDSGFPVMLGVAFFTEKNKEQMMIVSALDLTIQKRAQVELLVEKEKALSSTKLKTEFMSNVSHEFRTPLNSIIGMAELLKETELSVDQEKYIRVLGAASNLLKNMIGDIFKKV